MATSPPPTTNTRSPAPFTLRVKAASFVYSAAEKIPFASELAKLRSTRP